MLLPSAVGFISLTGDICRPISRTRPRQREKLDRNSIETCKWAAQSMIRLLGLSNFINIASKLNNIE